MEVLPEKNRAAVEKTVLAELKKLADEDVSAAELKRAKQGVLADAIFSRENALNGLADSIARGVTVGDLDQVKSYLPRIVAVTADDVSASPAIPRADERVVVWSLPKKAAALPRGHGEKSPGGPAPVADEGAATKEFSLKNTQRVELPNGLTLLLYEQRRLPIVVAEAYVRNVDLLQPDDKAGVAALVGQHASGREPNSTAARRSPR